MALTRAHFPYIREEQTSSLMLVTRYTTHNVHGKALDYPYISIDLKDIVLVRTLAISRQSHV